MNNYSENFYSSNNLYNNAFTNYDYGSFNEFSAPGQQFYSQPYYDSNSNFWCDACDRGFRNKMILQKHIAEQHNIRTRSMNTPEDIAKWITDRKRKYPSTENVIKRQKINEEKRKRGEVLTSNSFRKNHHQRHVNKISPKNKSKKFEKYNKRTQRHRKPKLANHNVLEKINKDDWKGDLPPFPGTKALFSDENSNEEEDEELDGNDSFDNAVDDQFSDDEWKEQIVKPVNTVLIKNALGLLMSNYSSSDNEDLNVQETKQIVAQRPKNEFIQEAKSLIRHENQIAQKYKNFKVNICLNEVSDDEPPGEEPIVHASVNTSILHDKLEVNESSTEVINAGSLLNSITSSKTIEGYSRNRKRHIKNNNIENKSKTNIVVNNKPKKIYKKETLLEMLLRNEIRHERNILLQCVKYIVDSDFFGMNCDKKNVCENQEKL